MSKIEQLIAELCPNGVAYKKLGEICSIKTGKGITQNDCSQIGIYPVISGGKTPMGYYHINNREKNTVTVSRVGANAGFVNFITTKFYLNDKCFSIIPFDTIQLEQKYLYYYLKLIENNIIQLQSEGGVPTINTKKVSSLNFPIAPLEIQQEIVRILDNFTNLKAELQAELQARKEQYEYYKNKLFSFAPNEAEWKRMGEIGTFIRGNGLQKKDFTESGIGCIHYGQIYTYYGTSTTTTKTFVSPELASKLRKAKKGNLVIATTSENVEDVCKAVAWLGEEDIAVSSDAYIFSHCQNPKYLAYLFQTEMFFKYKKKAITGTKVMRVSGDSMGKFVIPIPPLEEQQKIVSILEKFDILINDPNNGLPAEIEALQEQYEYYRDKLLTFERKA